MKRLVILVAILAAGCMTPLQNAGYEKAARLAASNGYARLQVAGEEYFVQREAFMQYLAVVQDLQARGRPWAEQEAKTRAMIVSGELPVITKQALAERTNSSGMGWRAFGDGVLTGTVYAGAATVAGYLIKEALDSLSSDSNSETTTVSVNSGRDTVVQVGRGNPQAAEQNQGNVPPEEPVPVPPVPPVPGVPVP